MLTEFKVVGVTFNDRQATLKRLFEAAVREDDLDVTIEPYDFEGEPAIKVYVNGAEIGNVAIEDVQDFHDLYDESCSMDAVLSLNGVPADEVGEAKAVLRDRKSYDDWDIEDAKSVLEEIEEEDPIYSAVIILASPDPVKEVRTLPEVAPMDRKTAKLMKKVEKRQAKLGRKEEKKQAKREKKQARLEAFENWLKTLDK